MAERNFNVGSANNFGPFFSLYGANTNKMTKEHFRKLMMVFKKFYLGFEPVPKSRQRRRRKEVHETK